jgi:hypothetical protein
MAGQKREARLARVRAEIPAIHVLAAKKDADARDEHGHDDELREKTPESPPGLFDSCACNKGLRADDAERRLPDTRRLMRTLRRRDLR